MKCQNYNKARKVCQQFEQILGSIFLDKQSQKPFYIIQGCLPGRGPTGRDEVKSVVGARYFHMGTRYLVAIQGGL